MKTTHFMPNRRQVAGAGLAATAIPLAGPLMAASGAMHDRQPDDERYWSDVAANYRTPSGVIQLENGYWGATARPVLKRFEALSQRVNGETSYYARRDMTSDLVAVRQRIAMKMGVTPDEIALTRNATEALKALIVGYNRLRAGDAVLYADLDYDSTQAGFAALKQLRGVDVVRIALPEPATHQGLIDAYEAALKANPRIRLMLLTHLSHRTGLVLPVRNIVAMARTRGVDTIVDAAHSWGQLDFRPADLGADFVGFNLHKWWGAPLGVGLVYIRRDKIDRIDPDPFNIPPYAPIAESRVHTGTPNYAVQLIVPAALDFQDSIGDRARARRFQYLRDHWAEGLRGTPGIEILTPTDRRLYGSITAFRLTGRTSKSDNVEISRRLLAEHRIFSVPREGPAKGACIRITPALLNGIGDVDALLKAVPKLLR